MKFLSHSASFSVFLFLLTCASTDISSSPNREMFRGPPPSELEWLIVFWVTGKRLFVYCQFFMLCCLHSLVLDSIGGGSIRVLACSYKNNSES